MSATLVETGLFLSPELAGTLMTPEEFDAAEDCEEGYVYELITGFSSCHHHLWKASADRTITWAICCGAIRSSTRRAKLSI